MGILGRMNQVIKSNLNELLTKTENPEKLVGQAILDMEESLRDGKKELVSVMAEQKVLARRLAEKETEAKDWEKRAMLALKAGDEALAREALVRKQRVMAEKASLEDQLRAHHTYIDEMKIHLDQCERKLDDTKKKKGTLVAKAKAWGGGPVRSDQSLFGSGEAFETFGRKSDEIDRLELEVEASREVNESLTGSEKDAEVERKLRDLERGAGLEDELRSLKDRLK